MSRQFATDVTTIYNIFCPVPFLPSPFGFRRLQKYISESQKIAMFKNKRMREFIIRKDPNATRVSFVLQHGPMVHAGKEKTTCKLWKVPFWGITFLK